MVEWLAGNRIRGTSTERTSTSGFNPVSGTQGGWKQISRVLLNSSNGNPTLPSFDSKRYYMLLYYSTGASNTTACRLRYNSANGNYGYNYQNNYGTNGAGGNEVTDFWSYANDDKPTLTIKYISNLAAKEKLSVAHTVQSAGSGTGTVPHRTESASKWIDTSNAITSFDMTKSSGTWNAGTEVVVLGWDPDDTHTDNFWERLDSSTPLSSTSNQIDSGTFTAKKYLWIQFYEKNSGDANVKMRFNNDNGANYCWRWHEHNTEVTTAVDVNEGSTWIWQSKPAFYNAFVINNATEEKLLTGHVVNQDTAGAANGVGKARWVAKWDNTSNQITRITVNNDATGSYDTGSFIKVWGHD